MLPRRLIVASRAAIASSRIAAGLVLPWTSASHDTPAASRVLRWHRPVMTRRMPQSSGAPLAAFVPPRDSDVPRVVYDPDEKDVLRAWTRTKTGSHYGRYLRADQPKILAASVRVCEEEVPLYMNYAEGLAASMSHSFQNHIYDLVVDDSFERIKVLVRSHEFHPGTNWRTSSDVSYAVTCGAHVDAVFA